MSIPEVALTSRGDGITLVDFRVRVWLISCKFCARYEVGNGWNRCWEFSFNFSIILAHTLATWSHMTVRWWSYCLDLISIADQLAKGWQSYSYSLVSTPPLIQVNVILKKPHLTEQGEIWYKNWLNLAILCHWGVIRNQSQGLWRLVILIFVCTLLWINSDFCLRK